MEFTQKEVKRSIRDFEAAIQDVMSADPNTYQSRIKLLISLCEENQVINYIVKPFFETSVDLDSIHKEVYGKVTLNLPYSQDEQIAYVLIILKDACNRQLYFKNLCYHLFKKKNFHENIQIFLRQVAQPSLRELIFRLNDLVEDEVAGKEEIVAASLSIVNHGTISAGNGSNIALGMDINQSLTYENIKQEIIKKVKESNEISDDSIADIEVLASDLEQELTQSSPSKTRLKEIASKVYGIGEQGLLKIFNTVVTDPRWGQAVSDTLLNM